MLIELVTSFLHYQMINAVKAYRMDAIPGGFPPPTGKRDTDVTPRLTY
jgi:hypothetical protein